MVDIVINKNDQIMMSLVHYFITKENYVPVRVAGVKDEVWLENTEGPYRIIRINCNLIYNDDQVAYDMYKTKQIKKQIKSKTLSFKINMLNIYLNLSDNTIPVSLDNIFSLSIHSLDEIKNNININEAFPNIKNDLIETNDDLDLIINATNDINEKTTEENKKFMKIFESKKIIATYIIMFLCIISYLFVGFYSKNYLYFSASDLAILGANNLYLVKSGEVWRLLTSAFLHTGLIHLIVNMYSLYVIGKQVETCLGKLKFTIIYLISAISASLMSLVFSTESVVSVGASGAIFGLVGALLYFGYHFRIYLGNILKNEIIPIVLLNLLLGFLISGIDNAAHIGGLIGGYLITMALGLPDKDTKKNKINGWISLILYLIFLSIVVFVRK